jgi:putative phosphoesterase
LIWLDAQQTPEGFVMLPAWMDYLPPETAPERVVACLGLISDTHMPDRLAKLPDEIFEVMRGVDLVLHMGDVGELWVLDRISTIAPVVAVHGNDDSADSHRELPYQQVVNVRGTRVVICHSHYPGRQEEMTMRKFDAWEPKLDRLFSLGAGARANVIVYGHSHIPMALRRDGVLLINPGAIASGNAVTRQLIRSVALLYILDGAPPVVSHIDLAAVGKRFVPEIDWEAGFKAALRQYSASILTGDLQVVWPEIDRLWHEWFDSAHTRPHAEAMYLAIVAIAHRCWSGEQEVITRDEALTAVRAIHLPQHMEAQVERALAAPRG